MATINNLASDRPDLQFTASMLGRTMARPTTRSWSNFKKAARYLKYEYHDVTMDEVKEFMGYSDFDWAGCKRSRRSMSGSMIVVGGAVIKSWSMSSGRGRVLLGQESRSGIDRHQVDDEGHGLGRGHQAACRCDCRPGDGESPGVGKIRHLEVRYFWLQEMAKSGVIAVRKVNGVLNPADVLTKPMSFSEMLGKFGRVHLYSDFGMGVST